MKVAKTFTNSAPSPAQQRSRLGILFLPEALGSLYKPFKTLGDLIMAEKVKLSKDGSSIDFVQSDSLPTSLKKFRQSPEIEGFYRFIFENDLQKEAYDILDRIIFNRKAKKAGAKKEAAAAAKEEKAAAKTAAAAKGKKK